VTHATFCPEEENVFLVLISPPSMVKFIIKHVTHLDKLSTLKYYLEGEVINISEAAGATEGANE